MIEGGGQALPGHARRRPLTVTPPSRRREARRSQPERTVVLRAGRGRIGAMAGRGLLRCNRSPQPGDDLADDRMAQGKDRDERSGYGGRKAGAMALPAELERSLRLLDDAQLDRLLEAAAAEPPAVEELVTPPGDTRSRASARPRAGGLTPDADVQCLPIGSRRVLARQDTSSRGSQHPSVRSP